MEKELHIMRKKYEEAAADDEEDEAEIRRLKDANHHLHQEIVVLKARLGEAREDDH